MRLLIAILIIFSLLITSCSIQHSNNNEWFKRQGLNLTECGIAATANVLRWNGYSVSNTDIRNYHKTPLWWSYVQITDIFNKYNINYTMVESTINNLLKLKENELALVYINSNHFIVISKRNNNFTVYDSIIGIYNSNVKDIYEKISFQYINRKYSFIKIKR